MAKTLKLFGAQITFGKQKRLFGLGREDEDYFAIMQQKFGVDYKSRHLLDSYQGIVYACITLIAESAGAYKPKIMRRKGDQLEDIGQHEFLDLLRRPSGRDAKATSMSMFDLFEATTSFLEMQGEVYWYMAKGVISGKPREIVVLRPDRVGIDIDKDTGDVNGYFIRRTVGTPIPLQVDEVLHFKYFNPKDPYHGFGTVQAADDYIATDEATSKFTRNFFNNNAGLSGVLNIKGEVTKGAFKKFVRAWRDKYEGVDNAGKVAIVRESDAAFTKVGLGLDELDMSALRKMTMEDVLVMFRVPLPLLGRADQTGLGRSSVETLEYIFAKYNIDNKLKRFDAIMELALARYYGGQDLIVQHANIIPEDKEFKLAERTASVDRWATRDEIRDEDGKDSIDGGDNLYVEINKIPLSDSGTTPPAAASSGSGKGLKLTVRRHIVKSPLPVPEGSVRCECCAGYGEHDTGKECYRCDAGGSVAKDSTAPIPCDGAKAANPKKKVTMAKA